MNAAVIVDSRPIDPKVIEDHMKFLPGWELYLFIQPNSVHLREQFDCKAAICPNIQSLNDYNRFMTGTPFWNKLKDYDRVLIFQQDSGLLREGIEEFLPYDFIGAPIKHIPFPRMNGGLSIRNPRKMLEVIEKCRWNGLNEDMFFCEGIMRIGGNLPDIQTASRFSVETVFKLGSLGFHACFKYLSPAENEQIMTQYDKLPK